jgi:hypothetical protein
VPGNRGLGRPVAHTAPGVQHGLPAWVNLEVPPVPTRDDLRELAVLTALGVAVGLVHLAVRPGLPFVAAPPAMCELSSGPAVVAEQPRMSVLEDAP